MVTPISKTERLVPAPGGSLSHCHHTVLGLSSNSSAGVCVCGGGGHRQYLAGGTARTHYGNKQNAQTSCILRSGRQRCSPEWTVIGIRLESVTRLPQDAIGLPLKTPPGLFFPSIPFPSPFPDTKTLRIYEAVRSLSILRHCSICLGCLSLLG